ncbi:MAG: hypothetical protein GY754_31920 [bacterium]|nr:hypothetical protein [bacterium]
MGIKKHSKMRIFLLVIFASILFFITACSDMGSWDLINNQETSAARPLPLITLSTASSSIAENGGTATIEITASIVWDADISVQLSCGGNASAGSDYSISSTTLVIPAGSLSATSTITSIDDAIDEVDETIIVAVDSVVNGKEDAAQQANISITDDDVVLVSLSLAGGGTIAEDGSAETVEVSLSAASAFDITVNLAYGGNAANTVDYSASSSITIPAGSTSGSCLVSSVVDTLDETNETVIVDIDTVTNGTEDGVQQETITINDDDAPPAIQFTAASSSGDEDSSASVELSLSAVSALAVDVNYSVSGSANGSGIDYTLAAGSASIAAGTTTTNISIPIIEDLLDEPNETIEITISAPVNATLGGNTTHTYVINDNDAAPQIQFTATSSSGIEAASPVSVGLSLSEASGRTTAVDYILTGTATGGGADYTLANGTATIPAGSSTTAISIPISIDALEEDDQTIILTLSNPGNASLGANTVYTYTILDTDRDGPLITAAEYFDTDSNGFIDHLKITLDETVNDSTFDGYGGSSALGSTTSKWLIAGYSNVRIDTRDSIDGGGGENDSVLWLAFDEKTDTYDTELTPELTVTDASLRDYNSGNCYLNTSNGACSTQSSADIAAGDVTETDKAAPVMVDAVSDTGFNRLTVTFSEPVDNDGGACDTLLDTGDFTYGDASLDNVSNINSMGTDCNACVDRSVTVILNGSFSAADSGTDTVSASLNSVYDAANNPANTTAVVIAGVSDYAAFYPLNGNGSDLSGNGNNFTSVNGTPAPDRNAAPARSYYLDGAFPSFLEISDPTDFDFTTEMTITIWVKLDDAAAGQKIIGKTDLAVTSGYVLGTDANQIYPEVRDSLGVNYTLQSGFIASNTWTHLAMTWRTGGKLRAYIDGIQVGETDASTNPIAVQGTGGYFDVGAAPWDTNAFPMAGNIDDIRMYGRELSPTEISVLSKLPAN